MNATTQQGISRSAALGGAAGAVVGAKVATEAQARPVRRRPIDVAVVGAGLSGLAAARALARAGHSVAVIEARGRVGGKTWTVDGPRGAWLDIGAQYIGPTQDRLAALARSYGVETFPTFDQGDTVMIYGGATRRFTNRLPLPPADEAEIARKLCEIAAMAATVPTEAPQRAPRAPEWDSQTAEIWLRTSVTTEGARFYLGSVIGTLFGAHPRDVSLLQTLFYVRSAGGTLEMLTGIRGAAQERRFVGGSQQIAKRIARGLGRSVHLRSPVRRIERRRDGVVVTTDRGVFRARRVIVAIAPPLAARIAYDPPLPAVRDRLTQRCAMGAPIKVQAVYPEPFWRAQGLNGISFSDRPPVTLTFDNSPPDGRPGILMGFVDGPESIRLTRMRRSARRREVLEAFARVAGPRAMSPLRYSEGLWPAYEWSRGAPVGFLSPGGWIEVGAAVRAPIGRIHWAGTETATVWCGYMDGAVRAGERAAAEVLRRLRA
jgi:monoamine oxidase